MYAFCLHSPTNVVLTLAQQCTATTNKHRPGVLASWRPGDDPRVTIGPPRFCCWAVPCEKFSAALLRLRFRLFLWGTTHSLGDRPVFVILIKLSNMPPLGCCGLDRQGTSAFLTYSHRCLQQGASPKKKSKKYSLPCPSIPCESRVIKHSNQPRGRRMCAENRKTFG